MSGPSNKAKRLARLFAEAYAADTWKGGGDPDDIPEIEQQLKHRRALLLEYIAFMEQHKDALDAVIAYQRTALGGYSPDGVLLSRRVRANAEAAPWVIEDIKKMEAKLVALECAAMHPCRKDPT